MKLNSNFTVVSLIAGFLSFVGASAQAHAVPSCQIGSHLERHDHPYQYTCVVNDAFDMSSSCSLLGQDGQPLRLDIYVAGLTPRAYDAPLGAYAMTVELSSKSGQNGNFTGKVSPGSFVPADGLTANGLQNIYVPGSSAAIQLRRQQGQSYLVDFASTNGSASGTCDFTVTQRTEFANVTPN